MFGWLGYAGGSIPVWGSKRKSPHDNSFMMLAPAHLSSCYSSTAEWPKSVSQALPGSGQPWKEPSCRAVIIFSPPSFTKSPSHVLHSKHGEDHVYDSDQAGLSKAIRTIFPLECSMLKTVEKMEAEQTPLDTARTVFSSAPYNHQKAESP